MTLFDQRIDKFKEGDFKRDDHEYKELEEQALKMMMQCDELTDVGVEVKVQRKQIIHKIQQMLEKLESKVLVYDWIVDENQYSIAV